MLVDQLPKDGLRIIVAEPLREQEEDSRSLRIYSVTYKLGSGKYIGDDQGLCDADRLTMCGRVVAEDAHIAYKAYMAKHPPKN